MIDGHAFRLRKLSKIDDGVGARAEKIRKAVRHIEAVVRQVQLASEAGEDAVYFRPIAIPFGDLVADAVIEVASTRSIKTDLNALPREIWGDTDMLRRVVANLLSNAIKYSPPGSPIQIRGWTDQDQAVLSIEDHGRGIPDDEKTKLSEPYYRAKNSHGVHGTGIGLYVAKRFIARHGGSIDIKSTLGVGTSVTIRIPIGHSPADQNRDTTTHPLH